MISRPQDHGNPLTWSSTGDSVIVKQENFGWDYASLPNVINDAITTTGPTANLQGGPGAKALITSNLSVLTNAIPAAGQAFLPPVIVGAAIFTPRGSRGRSATSAADHQPVNPDAPRRANIKRGPPGRAGHHRGRLDDGGRRDAGREADFSIESRVIAAVTRNGPASISTSAITPSESTDRTTPSNRFRAELRGRRSGGAAGAR